MFIARQVLALDSSNVWFLGKGLRKTPDEGLDMILRYDGQKWTCWSWPNTTTGLRAICMRAPDDGWAIGVMCLHWDGESWEGVGGAPEHGTSCSSGKTSELWVTGGDEDYGMPGGLLRYSGGAWQNYDAPRGSTVFRSMSLTDSGDGWAVGDRGLIARFDGNAWLKEKSPVKVDLVAVDAKWAGAWAIGLDGTVLCYDGEQWVVVKRFADKSAGSVSTLSQHEAFVSGSNKKGGKGFAEKVTYP
jgi:hypothetical protein